MRTLITLALIVLLMIGCRAATVADRHQCQFASIGFVEEDGTLIGWAWDCDHCDIHTKNRWEPIAFLADNFQATDAKLNGWTLAELRWFSNAPVPRSSLSARTGWTAEDQMELWRKLGDPQGPEVYARLKKEWEEGFTFGDYARASYTMRKFELLKSYVD